MATKVKGQAIKEGSIPLSALSNEIKDKIENAGGGADWNAQEGEAGYIENRTHYEYTQIVKSIDEEYRIPIEVDLLLINDWDDIDPYYMHHYIKLKNDLVIYKPYKEDDLYNKLFIPKGTLLGYLNDSSEIYDIQDCITDFSIGGFGTSETTIVEENNNWFIKHYNDDYSEDIIIRTELKNIDEKYIPNTVLKTTPQTLSNTDKNQALANLGIADVLPYYIKISNEQDWNGSTYDYSQLVALGISSKFLQGAYKNCFVDLKTSDGRNIILPMSYYESNDQRLLRAVFGKIMGEEDFEMLISFEIVYIEDSDVYTLSSYIG